MMETTLVRSGDRTAAQAASARDCVLPLSFAKFSAVTATAVVGYIFQKWSWQAQPSGPQGQTKDRLGLGTIWLVGASHDPTHSLGLSSGTWRCSYHPRIRCRALTPTWTQA